MRYFEMKKRAFMSIVNSLKGFIRKISGVPPITLPDCVDDDSLISYSIEGNGVGDKTKNLLDISKYKVNGQPQFTIKDGVIDLTYYTWTHNLYYEISGLKPSTNYTFSLVSNKQAQMYYNDVNWFAATTKNADGYYTCSQTIKSSTTGTMKIAFKYSTDDKSFSCKAWNIQLEEGTSKTTFEPFGYKIPIKMSGKNLYDHANSTWSGIQVYKTNDGLRILVSSGEASYGLCSTSMPYDKTYTLTYSAYNQENGERSSRAFVRFYDADGNNISSSHANKVSSLSGKNGTYNSYYNGVFLDLGVNNGVVIKYVDGTVISSFKIGLVGVGVDNANLYYTNIQLEEDTTATEYESFVEPITTNIILDEPLIAGNVLEYPKDDIPKLPTVKGTTIYSVETEAQPTNMSVEYYATRKGE